jgi:hypothetical protein
MHLMLRDGWSLVFYICVYILALGLTRNWRCIMAKAKKKAKKKAAKKK